MSAAHWLANLLAWSMQAAVLIAAGGAAVWIWRIRAPQIRLTFWQALLALCLLLPAVERWRAPADGTIQITTSAARPLATRPAGAHALPWRQALLLLLAAGCAVRALWLAGGFVKLRRWRLEADPYTPLSPRCEALRAALAPHAEFRLSPSAAGPVTFGFRRPVVLLPGHFSELPGDVQEVIVCHELLHVHRRDWIVTLTEQVVQAVFWFHPAVCWLLGQTQLAREQVVDGEVVARTGNREQYLEALLVMAANRPALDLAPAALFLRKRHLHSRVALLLKEVTMSKSRIVSFCAASSGLVLAAGWLALHTFPLTAAPVPQEPAQSNLLHSVAPKYPEAARQKHIEGDVVLEVHIDAEGHVSDAKALSGPEELRAAALEAVLQWHYSPQAMSLPATTQVTVNFTMPKDGPPKVDSADLLPEGRRITLKTIAVEGLTDSARAALLQQLPAHEGDTVDADSLHTLIANVRTFDEHLTTTLSLMPDNSGILHLRAPGTPAGPAASPVGSKLPPTRIRISGNVQQAKLVVQTVPAYPAEAKAQHIQGLVRLQAIIGTNGAVENLVLLSGLPELAGAAMEAVQQWKYQPTLLNGNAIEVMTEIEVNFTLSQ